MIGLWSRGLLRRRPARLIGTATGIAVAVALLASLGAFLAHSKATMTDRAARGVGVDWQVQVQPGADPNAVAATVRSTPGVTATSVVGVARSTGLTSTTGGTRQATGAGVVLGLPDSYRALFPAEIRTLTGSGSGVLVAQQTASNLHVTPGDTVTIARTGLTPVPVVVAGVVDLPQANSLFQTVGAPAGSQPTAPPDNVVLLPQATWQTIFAPLAAARPDMVSTQVHTRLSHALPTDPAAAYTSVTAAAKNLEARSTGTALVGDNLGAALDAARSDAAYAQVLFLFLGLPGAVLAGLLTATVAASGATRRRSDQALLRARGATARQLLRLATVEAALAGAVGGGIGLAAAALIGRFAFGTAAFGTSTGSAVTWAVVSVAVGMGVAWATIALPARRDLRHVTVAAARDTVGVLRYPAWARYGLDLALLGVGIAIFVITSRTGYQLVLAPEGVPTISVSYWALTGPALIWLGAGMLIWRLTDLVLGRGRRVLTRLLRPVAGRLATPVAAGISRQRRPLTRAVVVFALAVAFAASTATFNATYAQQAEADAQLTNGADVTVTEPPGATVAPAAAAALAAVPGVRGVEPVQHRFAYVGADLQDLYGVRPTSIMNVTALQNSYFVGATAAALMHTLATRPDSILVSAETVKDYQLTVGDTVNLRLVDARTGTPHPVAFRFVGVVNEFPTAPKDSFFVANATYVAQQTGSDTVGAFLVNTGGSNTTAVADRIRAAVGTSATVSDIATTRGTVGSSLTSVDLAGLTRVELTFALGLVAASGGVVLALGLAERRRTTAIAVALGARRRQVRGMVLSEAAVLTVGGVVAGTLLAAGLTQVLVKVLTGVFDPPPDTIALPWTYLAATVVIGTAALGAAVVGAVRHGRRPVLTVLRDL